MEEITCMKETLSCIFETNDKVLHILQQWEANEDADKDQSRRINDLDVSFQRLESRVQKGDDDFRQLEDMVRDLGSKVERAATAMSYYTQSLKKGHDLKSTEGQPNSPENGGSQLPLRRRKHKTDITKHNPGHRVNESVVNIKGNTTEKHKSKKKVRFADEADQQCVKSENISKGHTTQQSTTSKTFTGSDRQNRAAKQHGGFKRKLTKTEEDNRLNYSKKVEMKKRDKKRTANIGLCEKSETTEKENDNIDFKNFADLLKDDKLKSYMTDEVERQTQKLMESAGMSSDGLGPDLLRTGLDESWKLLLDEPDLIGQFVHQEGQPSVDTMMEDHMKLAEVIEEMTERAEREKRKGEAEKLPRGVGPDTVLCLDTSGSMEGAAFRDMIVLALQFVEGIQHVSVVLGIEENVGIATFGKKPCVPLHLTNRYDKVKDVLLSLKPEGPSPLFEGIHMALAACEGNGRRVTMRGIHVGSRIILISDGKGTPDQWRLPGDTVGPNDAKAKILVNSNIIAAGQLLQASGNTMYCVPVGDYDERPLELVARLSGGDLIKSDIHARIVQHAQHQSAAANHVHECKDLEPGVDREPFLKAMIGVESTTPGEPNYEQSKMDTLTLAMKYTKRREMSLMFSGQSDVMEEVNSYMPCIGTRVRRGPTWHWGNQDSGGPGTVVGHDSESMVWVEWDLNGDRNTYHYIPGVHDVMVVDGERQLTEHQNIAVGCKVKRGKDWVQGDQDGGEGNIGVVCRTRSAGFVHVRWPNKVIRRYRFGAGGRYEVELVGGRKPGGASVTILPPRTRNGSTADRSKETRTEMSVEDMNRRNQSK